MMTFDPTKPVRTKNGRKARIIATDCQYCGDPSIIVALIQKDSGDEFVEFYRTTGRRFDALVDLDHDLVNIPERKERFINIPIPSVVGGGWSYHHTSIKDCDESQGACPMAGRLKLTFEGDDLVDVEILEKR